jgi:hypothetical protein
MPTSTVALKVILVDVDKDGRSGSGRGRRGRGSRGLPQFLSLLHFFELGLCIPPLFPCDEVVEGFFDMVGFELLKELFPFLLGFSARGCKSVDPKTCFRKFSVQSFCLASDVTKIEELVRVGGFPDMLNVLEGILHLFRVQEVASKGFGVGHDGEGVVVGGGEARVKQGGGNGRHLK